MIEDSKHLIPHVMEELRKGNREPFLYPGTLANSRSTSAVLFLLSECPQCNGLLSEPCLVLNKRSKRVRQPGDLCFPGGAIAPSVDATMARFLGLPFFPLGRWPYWKEWQSQRKEESGGLSLLLAAGLREGLEEMRLNPLGTTFLGPMPPQELHLFGKMLYPLVVWIRNQKRFFPNREVEKVVSIPLKEFLKPENYICYRMHFEATHQDGEEAIQDFAGFLPKEGPEQEVLWGATYRIVISFLEMVFGFSPPDINSLTIIKGSRGENYFKENLV